LADQGNFELLLIDRESEQIANELPRAESFIAFLSEVTLTTDIRSKNRAQADYRLERYVSLGLTVFIVLFCAAVSWRDKPVENANTVVLLRTLLAAACGVFVGTVPGFLNVRYNLGGFAIRAAGGLAFAVLAYMYTPAVLPNIQTPTEQLLNRARSGDIGKQFKLANSYWDLPTNRKRYQETKLEDRGKLLAEWVGSDTTRNDALLEVPAFLADLHACIQSKRCDADQLCASSLFDDADNFLIFFAPLLTDWAKSGYTQTLVKAQDFIGCDCYKALNAKRCPDHPSMCSAPPKCEGRST
jgi:hypothetical protein